MVVSSDVAMAEAETERKRMREEEQSGSANLLSELQRMMAQQTQSVTAANLTAVDGKIETVKTAITAVDSKVDAVQQSFNQDMQALSRRQADLETQFLNHIVGSDGTSS
ncbi:unnamed protein product [Prorocentrum cordatum]|uniref:Biogenesis of lysosome-related organelles complex 1 subunit 1 n=1 Tax=Prorocentrum cordatum TaxID=2364126 RepID=A0ABN9PP68_9DINO|nr:unnamed protein product [Polarella glacialis]